ncbi:MAG: hypothetical protein K0V04_15625 [Deltaproteobacteria bacterium]|nr:hypothetical protein [Deltaproteobacteria bacterium]
MIAWSYVVPALRRLEFRAAVTPLLLLHSLRHMGLIYLLPQVVPLAPPEQFAVPTAWGDVVSAALALLALWAVRRRSPFDRAAVWVFNVVGVADLLVATVLATQVEMMQYAIGPAYVLPVIVVPALLVSHGLVQWVLLRRRPA